MKFIYALPILILLSIFTTFSFAQISDYTLLQMHFQIEDQYISTWKDIGRQVQGSFGHCFLASSTMQGNYDGNEIVLVAAQTPQQSDLDDCQSNVFAAAIVELDGVIKMISWKNKGQMDNQSDCIDVESAPNTLACGDGCSVCPIGSICDTTPECVFGKCEKTNPNDQLKYCQATNIATTPQTSFIMIVMVIISTMMVYLF